MTGDRERIACWLLVGAGRDLPILAEAFEAMLLDCAERAFVLGVDERAHAGGHSVGPLPADFRLVSVNIPGAPPNLGDDLPLTGHATKREQP